MALSRDIVIRMLGDASSAIAAQKAAADAAEVSVGAYRKAEREFAKQQAAEKAALSARRDAMKESGQNAVILGGVMLAAFGIAANAAMEFDKAMSAVGAASMASAEDMEKLRAAALEAGKSTAFSATEAAQAQTELAKAGLSTADILGGALTGALDLAAAGQMEVATAAEIAATALKVFGLSGADVPHVADLLAAGAGKAQGSVEDLSGALNQSALVAKNTGLSIEDTTGALALFASNGLLGSDAGTSFKTMLMSLNPRSDEAAGLMESLGLKAYDAQGNFVGLAEYADQLKTGLGGLSQEQRNSALQTIFGTDAIRAATILYQSGAKGVEDWTEKVNDAGFAQEQAAKLTDNLAGDLEKLGGSISTTLIEGGSQATGVLRWLTQAATGAVDSFGSLPGPLQGAAGGLIGVVGGGTLLLGLLGTIIPRIQEAREALEAMGPAGAKANTALGVIGKAGGGALAAAAGIGLLSAAYDAINPATEIVVADTQRLTGQLKGLAGSAVETSVALRRTGLDELIEQLGMTENKSFDLITSMGDLGKAASFTAPVFGLLEEQALHANDGFKQAEQSIKDTDSALSGMVNGGSAEAAAKAAVRLYEAWVAAGGTAQEFKEKFPDTVAALESYSSTSETVVSQTGEITTGMGEAAAASDILKEAFDRLNGVSLSNAQANVRWTETLAGVKVAAEDGSKSLDLNTLSGAQNAQQFIDATSRANEFSQTIADTQGLDKGRAALDSFRNALIDQAVKAGFSRESVEGLITSLFRVPEDTPTAVTLHDQATPGIGAVNSALDTINGKTSTVYVKTVTTEIVNKILNAQPIGPSVGTGGNPIGFPKIPPRASGGPVWANQTFLVGEEGPELVQFGASGYVTPADMTARAMAAAGSGVRVGSGSTVGSGGGAAIDYGRLAAAMRGGRTPTIHVDEWNSYEGTTPHENAEALAMLGRTRG